MINNNFFQRVVDEIVLLADNDPELKNALQWIDKKCQITGQSFTNAVFEIIYKDKKGFKN